MARNAMSAAEAYLRARRRRKAYLAVLRTLLEWRAALLSLFWLLVEAMFYRRQFWKRVCIEKDPGSSLAPAFDLKRHRQWFAGVLRRHPRPVALLESVFQCPVGELSRDRVVHWLCMYLTTKEVEAYAGSSEPDEQSKLVASRYRIQEAVADDTKYALPSYPGDIVAEAEALLEGMQRRGGFQLKTVAFDGAPQFLPANVRTRACDFTDQSLPPDFVRPGRWKITAFHKPLCFVLFMRLFRAATEAHLNALGFQRRVGLHRVVFWILPPTRDAEAEPPIFFFHGVGFGVIPYIGWIQALAKAGDGRCVVAVEYSNMSHGRADATIPVGVGSPHAGQYAEAIHHMMKRLPGHQQRRRVMADMVGHSYGTAVISFFTREWPGCVRRRVLIDPVTFPVGIERFLAFGYEGFLHSYADLWRYAGRSIGRFFALWFSKGDLDCQHMAKRACHVFEMMHPPDVPLDSTVMVVLSGQDALVDASGIESFLRAEWPACTCIVEDSWRHGGFVQQPDPNNVWIQMQRFVQLGHVAEDANSESWAVSSDGTGTDGRSRQSAGGSNVVRVKSSGSLGASLFGGHSFGDVADAANISKRRQAEQQEKNRIN